MPVRLDLFWVPRRSPQKPLTPWLHTRYTSTYILGMHSGVTMSIKHSLLALLWSEPMYGAQLRSEFERRTGGTWPLNVGQVYTTLARLERDGFVEGAGAADEDGRIPYRLTDAGRAEVDRWWADPVDREQTPRNELAIKQIGRASCRERV